MCQELVLIAPIDLGNIEWLNAPLAMFSLGAAVSMVTGSSWITLALVIPLVFVAEGVASTALLGAAISGAVVGDHGAPHSDTLVSAAVFNGISPFTHARAQAPLVLFAIGASAVVFACCAVI